MSILDRLTVRMSEREKVETPLLASGKRGAGVLDVVNKGCENTGYGGKHGVSVKDSRKPLFCAIMNCPH